MANGKKKKAQKHRRAALPSGRPATIKDIAASLGIVSSTVSRALSDHPHVSDETKAKVRAAAARLGYIAHSGARLMHSAHSNLIGYIIPDLENQAFASQASQLAANFARSGYHFVLSISEDDPQLEYEHVRTLMEARATGILIAACYNTLPKTVDLLQQVPAVQISSRNQNLPLPMVAANEQRGVYWATRHLLQLGHRRIAFIAGSGLHTAAERTAGYHQALAEAGVAATQELVFSGPVRPSFGQAAMSQILSMNPVPTGVVVGGATLTLGAIEFIHQAGIRVPEFLSFVGFGDPSWFKLWGPGVTTLRAPATLATETVMSVLLERIQARARGESFSDEPQTILFDPELVVRGTTGPPRKS